MRWWLTSWRLMQWVVACVILNGLKPSLASPSKETLELQLVPRGHARACVFADAARLRSKQATDLLLSSHPGLAVVPSWKDPAEVGGGWGYIELGVGEVGAGAHPVRATFDGTFVICRGTRRGLLMLSDGLGLWAEGMPLMLLAHLHNRSKMRVAAMGAFRINDDGTISPKARSELVLGTSSRELRAVDGEGAAALVAGALAGWAVVGGAEVSVQDISGMSGSKTFKVSSRAGQPPMVALHLRDPGLLREVAFQDRIDLATLMLTDAGLAPRLLAQDGGNWFIDEWVGSSFEAVELAPVEGMGKLLADVHQLDATWFDTFRHAMQEAYTPLREAGKGSIIWFPAIRFKHALSHRSAMVLELLVARPEFDPTSRAASRIVFTHGDFKPGNIIAAGGEHARNELQVVDVEFAHSNFAAWDLAFAITFCSSLDGRPQSQRAFLRAYLESMARIDSQRADTGYARVSEQEVNEVLLDIHIFARGVSIAFHLMYPHLPVTYDMLAPISAFVIQVRSDPLMQSKILATGQTKQMLAEFVDNQ
eukprot:CAMPEP_0204185250 /NCGR_PEP_ID=MMETSP0361-20130328/55155_1 /ASSEMBLY_ACC=CAM_ASM_000343 /TAXON_ID=268821 /ORGANISM="Scrippsiella Hangoei, Strain SHTV-5" /LENGTH=535 /DNA_ID=CAMNT_0051145409 /DNA_START=188 /DNA_END=1792 /DNA_ORIENTATION=+